jgi:hypothetical protein
MAIMCVSLVEWLLMFHMQFRKRMELSMKHFT